MLSNLRFMIKALWLLCKYTNKLNCFIKVLYLMGFVRNGSESCVAGVKTNMGKKNIKLTGKCI